MLVERQAVDEGLLADFVDAECAGLGVDGVAMAVGLVSWAGRRGEDGMGSDPPPDDVRLARYAFFPVAEGRPAVVAHAILNTRVSSRRHRICPCYAETRRYADALQRLLARDETVSLFIVHEGLGLTSRTEGST